MKWSDGQAESSIKAGEIAAVRAQAQRAFYLCMWAFADLTSLARTHLLF